MTPERWRQIEELYHEARAKDADARGAFLDGACAGDDELRREVASLLEQPDALGGAPTVAPPGGSSLFFEDLIGRQLGKFRVVALLRDGGMARVYKGYQESVDRFVAVKVLPRQYANDPRFVERFKQEARIVANLHHPHILSVFDHGESDGYTFLAMPFVETGTLADLLARGPVSFAQTQRIIAQVCGALDYAHAQGIVHRDIKPSNILMDAEGNAFVADFGIATILGNTRHLTQTGAFLASPGYCSPEQLKGGEVGPHSDLYSVGMVLYEMLTGTAPFELDGSLASILKRADSTLPNPRVRNSGITPALEAVIVKALAPSRQTRFPSGKELAAALSAAIQTLDEQRTVTAPIAAAPHAETSTPTLVAEPIAVPRRRRVPVVWAGVAAAVVLAGIVVTPMLRRAAMPASAPVETAAEAQRSATAPAVGPASEPRAATATTDEAARPAPSTATRSGIAATPLAAAAPNAGNAHPAEAPGAKQLYATSPTADAVTPGLKYRVIQQRGDSESDADPSATFHSGDHVRFAFESNIDGYLYVVSAGSSGRWTVLFPNPGANGGMNAVTRSAEYLVPDNTWFKFDETPGTEELFVVLSKRPLETLPGFKTPVTRNETVDRAVVVGLQASLQSRDLVLEKDQSVSADGRARQATYVVNRGELASQVAALIQLTHEK